MKKDYLKIVEVALHKFYNRRIEKLSEKDIFNIIKRKNPYLYRAFGTNDGHTFVRDLLLDTQTSSDETLFGEFFEEVAINVSENGRKSATDSIDLEIWTDDMKSVKLYAVKSGPNVFNAMSKKRQNDSFKESMRRLRGIAVTPIVGYCYGRKVSKLDNKNNFEEKAGQVFWEDISGERDFYINLIDFIGKAADAHREEFRNEWEKCLNRLYKKFMDIFGDQDGTIAWNKILEYNSGEELPKGLQKEIRKIKNK